MVSSAATKLYRGRVLRLKSDNLRAATHATERGDHDFCLSRSRHTDTDPTSREWGATAGIEPMTSSPAVAALPTELPLPRKIRICDTNEMFLKTSVTFRCLCLLVTVWFIIHVCFNVFPVACAVCIFRTYPYSMPDGFQQL